MSSLRAVPVGTGKLQDNLGVDAAVERTTVGFPERRESSRCCMLPNATRLQRHPSPACSDPIGTAGQDLRLPPLPREESRQRLLLVDQRIDHWVFEFLVVHFLLRSRTAPSAMADGRPARGAGAECTSTALIVSRSMQEGSSASSQWSMMGGCSGKISSPSHSSCAECGLGEPRLVGTAAQVQQARAACKQDSRESVPPGPTSSDTRTATSRVLSKQPLAHGNTDTARLQNKCWRAGSSRPPPQNHPRSQSRCP